MTNVLVPPGSLWKYLDDGSDQGTAWRAPAFDDSRWPEGFAQFGYGDWDEETILGPDSPQKYVTYYFRTWFTVHGSSTYASLSVGLLRDDGAVIYINGSEVTRNNMPAGAIGHRTLAATNVTGAGESTFITTNVSPAVLVEGLNLIAVEVHQRLTNSADLSFDLRLSGVSVPPVVTRGPYLQRGGTTNITVRWRTSVPVDSGVSLGPAPGVTARLVTDAAATTEHEVAITGLQPDTKYWYSIRGAGLPLAGDASHYFVTAPTRAKPTRVWVIGDAGTASSNQRMVRDAYANFASQQPPNLWLMLGDNAYGSGTDLEYQAAVFNMYPQFLRQTVAWSTIGNHETYSGTPDNGSLDFPFLHIFNQPVNGECGGIPSGTERYFSFDYGNIHFVCLDAMTSDRRASGPMCTWLQQDLQSNTNLWLIAFWHHPPYTKGTHDSDGETELIEMRQNAVPILESYGVDLVLCGHSHVYERSFLIDGHYGYSSSFTASMKQDDQSGRDDVTGPYVKPTAGVAANQGAVYVVAGSAGYSGYGELNHPAMFYSSPQLGSLVLDIDGPILRGKFLRETGAIDDYFTIIKGGSNSLFGDVTHEFEGNVLTLRWRSRSDRYYLVERTPTLTPASWTAVAPGVPGSGGRMTWSITPAGAGPAGFFRVKQYED